MSKAMTRTSRSAAPRRERDEGVTMVVFALSVTAIILIAALAIDGGRAYANRRQMQNSADVAATAGTKKLAELKFGNSVESDVSKIVAVVKDQSGLNKADQTADQLDCWLVSSGATPNRLPLANPKDICDSPNTSWAEAGASSAAGVEVRTARQQTSFLASIAKIDTFNARASATATMQPLVGSPAPFLVCTNRPWGPMVDASGNVIDAALTQNGGWYAIQGPTNSGVPDCGAGSSDFDGLGGGEPVVVNAWATITPGNGFSYDVLNRVVNSPECTPDMTEGQGCLMVLPLVSKAKPGSTGKSIELWVVNFGVFQVWGNGKGAGQAPDECRNNFPQGKTPKYCGKFLGAAQVTGGTGGTGDVGKNDPYLIRLVPNPRT